MSDDELFAEEMQGVTRFESSKISSNKVEEETPGKRVRRKLAVADKLTVDPLASTEVPMLKSNDILDYKRDGVQHGVYKKLRMGRYELDARLDLHRMTVEQARREVFRFIDECSRYELRAVIILHGKGDRNPDKLALLKSHLAIWLPQLDQVIAFHSAQPQHGGTGAVYVMLRKGDTAKQNNRERHGLR
ncbi:MULTISPECIES: DNA endonuclease SmrA [unclassified Oleiphilus]|jgi:DNA-nicking Smr family endonuclease|nr:MULTISPECIES: DNA endonuclease SmrA [unclassified Oleiphilus]KZY51551.1 DNA mismatch repair protein MutS [Oleiphilus sp. HI0050]KZY81545.1 DNA mismatch repair protein MutS [Oleiphilus sp. HI0068]KZY86870.1 DNA mismatch repair protein MutS [Oleiphilus sp. HI0069]KZZ10268.1 DNA mismatch repair protein MutS [Oleiphilus sp. HI0078]KZZ19507.1 DNA mismatch repair protein MutS [Oleiphilus sp. HI0081]KZZ66020.1 DNA mismatch repair protein MutS [Oleiphilus sp. HI0128]